MESIDSNESCGIICKKMKEKCCSWECKIVIAKAIAD